VKVEVIPGVSALTTALTGSGLPTDEVRFLGFAPSRSGERRRWLAGKLGTGAGTSVLFEAPGRLTGLLADMAAAVGDRYVVIAHELTKVHESWHRGWLSDLTSDEASTGLPHRGEFVVLVSDQKKEGAGGEKAPPPSDGEVAALFENVSRTPDVSRRDAINQVATTFALSSKAVYAIVERMKVSGK